LLARRADQIGKLIQQSRAGAVESPDPRAVEAARVAEDLGWL